MSINSKDITVVHNAEASRFEIIVGDMVAFSDSILRNNRIFFTHTEVPESLEGNGIASALAKSGLTYAREQGLEVMPICPYVKAYTRNELVWENQGDVIFARSKAKNAGDAVHRRVVLTPLRAEITSH